MFHSPCIREDLPVLAEKNNNMGKGHRIPVKVEEIKTFHRKDCLPKVCTIQIHYSAGYQRMFAIMK